MHTDITPSNGVDAAITSIVELGGSVQKEPSLYLRPGSRGDHRPLIDWAVMQDPFGNEFCLVDNRTTEQSWCPAHNRWVRSARPDDTAGFLLVLGERPVRLPPASLPDGAPASP